MEECDVCGKYFDPDEIEYCPVCGDALCPLHYQAHVKACINK